MERKVYFLQGHGEKEPNRTERDGYSALSGMLRRDNYMVERLVLAQQKDVPDDATVVVIAGPTSDLLPQEAEALQTVPRARPASSWCCSIRRSALSLRRCPISTALIKEWGITLGNNVVVDVSGATNDPSMAVAATYPIACDHRAVRHADDLSAGSDRRARVRRRQRPHGHRRSSKPAARSWAESNLASLQDRASRWTRKAATRPDRFRWQWRCPRPPTATHAGRQQATQRRCAEARNPRGRLRGFGLRRATRTRACPGNPNLFANAVNWLAQQEGLIAIRPTEAADRRVTMTPRQQRLAFLTSVLVMPGARVCGWHLHVVAEALTCARLTTTIVLLVVLGGLVGYIYFVDSGNETPDPERQAEGVRRSRPTTSRSCRSRARTADRTSAADRRQLAARRAGEGRCRQRRRRDGDEQPRYARSPARRGGKPRPTSRSTA